MKSSFISSVTKLAVLKYLYLLVWVGSANSRKSCNVCVEVAYHRSIWTQAYNETTVRRIWASRFSDIELKLQLIMRGVLLNIEFRDAFSLDDIWDKLPDPETHKNEYVQMIANESKVNASKYCINILLLDVPITPYGGLPINGKDVRVVFYIGTRSDFQLYIEQHIFTSLNYDIRGHELPNQFEAYPMDVLKWENSDVCSSLADFPVQAFPTIPYENAEEQCSFWFGGTFRKINDVCELQECRIKNFMHPIIFSIYPSYNLPCGGEKICVQGQCLPSGVQIELNSRGLCMESTFLSTTVRAEKCERGTYQDQIFMLNDTNQVGFSVQLRTYNPNSVRQCLTVSNSQILVKNCNEKDKAFAWRFLYSFNETGYLLNHISSKTFVAVKRNGEMVLSPSCNLAMESQRWKIHQVEGNQLLDTSKIDPENDFPWMFEKDTSICPSSSDTQQNGDNPGSPGGLKSMTLFAVFGSIAIAVLLLALSITIYLWIQYKRKTASKIEHLTEQFYKGDIENIDKSKWLNEQLECIPFSKEWEFPVNSVKIGETLGSGAFGTVMKGYANDILRNNEQSVIAIKMCRTRGKREEFEALASEMKILAYLGSHENIVRLLGVCAKEQNLMVLLEYCTHGSLKQFLVRNRDSYGTDRCLPHETGEFLGYQVIHQPATFAVEPFALRAVHLHQWTAEIAAGMEYMAEKRVLHGDLAARNVLLGECLTAKICDFGLSQKLLRSYNYKTNKLSASIMLPLKWMAIESIELGVFSSQSDVWSYGVLLWEIFSLGTVPYAGLVMNNRLIDRIKNGFRLGKPTNCTDAVYEIMLDCWSKDPNSRPTFSGLRIFFAEKIGSGTDYGFANNRSLLLKDSSAEMNIVGTEISV